MPRRQITRICAEGWYYLFVVLFIIGGAVLGEVNLLVVLAGMMIGPLLFNWRLVQWTIRELRVERSLPQRICAGDWMTVAITARNGSQRLAAWAILAEDRIVRAGEASSKNRRRLRVLLPRIPAQNRSTAEYRVLLARRGKYEFGPLKVSTRFPLGLVRAGMVLDDKQTLLVCPQLGHLTQRWRQVVTSRQIGSQSVGREHGTLEGDYYGLREWRAGDSQRWIHWRTSAKLGELAVRQFEQQRNRDLILILDLWQPDLPTEDEQLQVETAISFLATSVVDLCNQGGSQVVLSVAGRETKYWSGAASTILAHEVMDHLAEAEPGDGLQIYQVLEEVRQMSRSASHAMVISTRGAPFLTSGDEWDSESHAGVSSRSYGSLTWIDCGSDTIEKYFRSPRTESQQELAEV